MKLRELVVGLGASALAVAGLGIAGAAPASAATPTVCTVAGTATLSPAYDLLFGNTGNYSFTSVSIVCAGGVTGVGTATSSGTFSGSGATSTVISGLDGTFGSSLGCSGTVSGTRVGGVIVASISAGACGNGELVLNITPSPLGISAGTSSNGLPTVLVSSVVLAGAAELS